MKDMIFQDKGFAFNADIISVSVAGAMMAGYWYGGKLF